MAWKQDSGASFSGGSGQMAVIAELLHRRCNAAVPHVDVGTDVFAFRDDREDVARIQVKTEAGKRYKTGGGFHAKFGVPMAQLRRKDVPPLFFALVVRLDDGWAAFLIIGRAILKGLWDQGLGSENSKSGDLELHVQFRPEEDVEDVQGGPGPKLTAKCGTDKTKVFDLSEYLNAWETLPPLRPLAPSTAAEQSPGLQLFEPDPGEVDRGLPPA
jgi:hypothetical protein